MSDELRRSGDKILRHNNKPVKFTGCGLRWICLSTQETPPPEGSGCEAQDPLADLTGFTVYASQEQCDEACLWYGRQCDEFNGCTQPNWSDTGGPRPHFWPLVADCADCIPSYTCFDGGSCLFSGFRPRNTLDLFPNDPFSFFSDPNCNGQCAENEFP